MAKKSFFERLTGASWSEEKSSEKKKKKKKKKLKESSKKSIMEKSISLPKKEKKIAFPKKIHKEKKESPKSGKSDEWLTESEGQLTIDVYQTPNEIVIKSTIAGVKSEDIDITISNDMITIKGKRAKDEDVKDEDYYYQECYWGAFSRSIILPVDVESEQAQASMKNGILTIRLPKAEKVKTKKIEIMSE